MPDAIALAARADHGRRGVRTLFGAAGPPLLALRGIAGRAIRSYRAHYWRQAAYDAADLAELRDDELVTAFLQATGRRGTAPPVEQQGDRPDAPRRDASQA